MRALIKIYALFYSCPEENIAEEVLQLLRFIYIRSRLRFTRARATTFDKITRMANLPCSNLHFCWRVIYRVALKGELSIVIARYSSRCIDVNTSIVLLHIQIIICRGRNHLRGKTMDKLSIFFIRSSRRVSKPHLYCSTRRAEYLGLLLLLQHCSSCCSRDTLLLCCCVCLRSTLSSC